MRRSSSIGASTLVAAVLTYSLVYSAVNFDPSRTFVTAVERLWSYAHGWPPLSHVQDFGRFYAPLVQLLCPLLGFGLFCGLSRRQPGLHFWKPAAIAVALTLGPGLSDLASRAAVPWVEAARTAGIVLLMVWSVESARLRGRVSVALQP